MHPVLSAVLTCLIIGGAWSLPSKPIDTALQTVDHHHVKRDLTAIELTLVTKIEFGLIALYNGVLQVGVVIDLNAGLILLADWGAQLFVLLDRATNLLHLIEDVDVVEWFVLGKSLSLLPGFINQVLATELQIKAIVLAAGLALWKVASDILDQFKDPILKLLDALLFILPLIAVDVKVVLTVSLWQLLNILGGVVEIVTAIGLPLILDAGLLLELGLLLLAPSGIERLALLLTLVLPVVGLTAVLPLLAPPVVIHHLANLGGRVLESTIHGLFTLIDTLVQVGANLLPVEVFIGRLWLRDPIIIDIPALLAPLLALASLVPEILEVIQAIIDYLLGDQIILVEVIILNILADLAIPNPFLRLGSLVRDIAILLPPDVTVTFLLQFLARPQVLVALPPVTGVPPPNVFLLTALAEVQLGVAIL